ncbi:MFS general substrate transporter [Panus rudis PR-1116 ss-1]|nr:MFS general substrate transporter [Panus rudis PR-1116 ss-1]
MSTTLDPRRPGDIERPSQDPGTSSSNSVKLDLPELPKTTGGDVKVEEVRDVDVDGEEEEVEDRHCTKDFGLIPIPKWLRHDPSRPHPWTLALNVAFGIWSTVFVANLYYCQPILIQLALSFNVSDDRVSRIPTLLQAGYAGGLLLITPLGDLVPRRPLLLLLTFTCATLTIGLPLTSSVIIFEVLSFLIGFATVIPQVLMPLAADLAPPHRRASALSIVLAGLLLGVLFSRVIAGVVAQFVTWRVVYWVALGMQWVALCMMWAMVPDFPRKNRDLTYWKIFWTMGKFCLTEPLLVQAVFVTIASSCMFSNYWVTLTFLLAGPPYHFSTLAIGLFALIGIAGVCCAPLIGRVVDKLDYYVAVMIATIALIIVWAIETGAGGISLAAPIITCFGMDLFRQMQHVSMTSWVFGIEPAARARLNAVLMIALFIGQVTGTSAGAAVFLKFGWRPAAALALAWQGFCLVVLLLRGPRVGRYTWFGWKNETSSARSEEVMHEKSPEVSTRESK